MIVRVSPSCPMMGILFNAYQVSISTEQLKLNSQQVQLNTEQSQRLAQSICYNLQSSVIKHVTDLDQVFLQRTYLRPYFYEKKAIGNKDKYYPEASATAELMLDVFDLIADQSKKYTDCRDDPEAWDTWVMEMFSNSPILRETMNQRRDWYADNLVNLYDKVLEEVKK